MNRLTWDSTAPRRHTRETAPKHPRPEDHAFADEADLLRVAWHHSRRISNF